MPPYPLDHLVYVVPDLTAAIERFAQLTGVRPVVGGRHRDRGTQNALVALGGQAYLEFLAADPANHAVAPPRWMGVDLVTQPTMTRWALKSPNLDDRAAALSNLDPVLGEIVTGSRDLVAGGTLRWRMTLPAPAPAVDLRPFFIDWSASASHPAAGREASCTVKEITLLHPEPEYWETQLRSLGVDVPVRRGDAARIRVTLATPNGELVL